MTKQESFKRRIRARMETTGERYAAARRALVEGADRRSGRTWAAQPEVSDAAVTEATGRGWNEWCDLIDAWSGRDDGHTAIATYLRDEHGVDPWWSQSVTGGYERITGLRLPHQMSDGTFTANRSRTVRSEAAMIRAALLSDEARTALFPDQNTAVRSAQTAKTIRIEIGPGVAQIAITDRGDDRTTISIQHGQLPTFDEVERWKFYWGEWLDAIEHAVEDDRDETGSDATISR